MSYLEYGEKELNHLKKVDPKLKEIIVKFGYLKRETNTNLFSSLVTSIISQQISTKAAKTITNNLISLIKELTFEAVLSHSDEELRSCGLSFKKISYIKGIAEAFKNEEISQKRMKTLSDEQIIKELTNLKGVGVWTGEMLLIHTFKRLDVFTFFDFALKNGLRLLHGLDEIDIDYFNYYKNLYSPYGTVASIYIWEYYKRVKEKSYNDE